MDALDLTFRVSTEHHRAFATWYASTDLGHKIAGDLVVTWVVAITAIVAAAIGYAQEPDKRVIAVAVVAIVGIAVSVWYWFIYARRAADVALQAERSRPTPGFDEHESRGLTDRWSGRVKDKCQAGTLALAPLSSAVRRA